MKKIKFFSVLSVFFLFTGCVLNMQDTITGNGKVVKQERTMGEFNGIRVSSGIDVILTQGDNQRVEVEADENLQEWIKTDVTGGMLRIRTDKSIRFAKTKNVYITCKTLNRIEVSSAGNVNTVNMFKTDQLEIEMSSAGDLKFEVEANTISIDISSAGNVYLKGKANTLKADLSSAGDLNAYDLEAKSGNISVSSAGNARVFITEEASFNSTSAGDINYKGDPNIKEIHTSSAGSVNKK